MTMAPEAAVPAATAGTTKPAGRLTESSVAGKGKGQALGGLALTLPAISFGGISIGDATGFLALILIGLSSIFMLLRSKLLKVTRNIAAIRGTHVAISALAGIFLLVHIAYLFTPPISVSMDLGYISAAVAVAVWLTGTAFLERLRDSLFFHGALSSILVGLVMVHAATGSANIPLFLVEIILGSTLVIMVANATYHLNRAVPKS